MLFPRAQVLQTATVGPTTGGTAILSLVGFADGSVAVPLYDGYLVLVDGNGTERWRVQTNRKQLRNCPEIGIAVDPQSGDIFALSEQGDVWGINWGTGEVLWHAVLPDYFSGPAGGLPVAIVGGTTVLMIAQVDTVFAFNGSNGASLWNATKIPGVIYNGAVFGDRLFLTGEQMVVLNVADGSVVDTLPFDTWRISIADDGILYILSTSYENITAINATNHAQLWTYRGVSSGFAGPPSVLPTLVCVGDGHSDLDCFERFTGTPVTIDSSLGTTSPSIADSGLLFVTNFQNGRVSAVDPTHLSK
jgi:outer membrane protein assembly factor BamB